MKKQNKLFLIGLAVVLLFTFMPEFSDAQCAMCKAVAESNDKQTDEQHFATNLNHAILYLMAIPYLVLMFLAFLFFKKSILAKLGKVFHF